MFAAATLPNLLSMISMFRLEHAKRDNLTIEEFRDWLVRHQHEELKNIIFQNAELSRQIEATLQQDHHVIMEQLDVLAKAVGSIASKLSAFENLANATPLKGELSKQACLILCEAAKSPIYPQIFITVVDGMPPIPLIGVERIDMPEPLDVIDDIGDLLTYGFLAKEGVGQSGYPNLRLTREGRRFAALLDQNSSRAESSSQPAKWQRLKMKVTNPLFRHRMKGLRESIQELLIRVGRPEFEEKGATLYCNIKCPPISNDFFEELKIAAASHGFHLADVQR